MSVSVCVIALLCTAQAGATTVLFNDFSSSAGLAINGNAAANVNNGIDPNPVLRLVPATTSQSGSAFSQTTLNAANFSTSFKFRITNPGGMSDGVQSGADGIVFVVQPVSSSLGGAGGGLGYQGISPSVGVEFDTWWNGWDFSTNHLGIDTNGSMTSLATVNVSPRFDDGNLWTAWVDYDGTTMEVRTNQTGVRPASPTLSLPIDLPTILGTTSAFVGLTAGTGAAYGNHDIISWEYRDQFNPITGAIPEPITMLAIGLSSMALAGYARRRTKRAGV